MAAWTSSWPATRADCASGAKSRSKIRNLRSLAHGESIGTEPKWSITSRRYWAELRA